MFAGFIPRLETINLGTQKRRFSWNLNFAVGDLIANIVSGENKYVYGMLHPDAQPGTATIIMLHP